MACVVMFEACVIAAEFLPALSNAAQVPTGKLEAQFSSSP